MHHISYDEKTKTLRGTYTEKTDARTIHKQVLAVLARQQESKALNALTGVAYGAAQRLWGSTPVTTKDCMNALQGAFNALTPVDIQANYIRESSDRLQQLDITTGPLKIMYMELYLEIVRRYIAVSICHTAPATPPSTCDDCGNTIVEDVCDACGNLPKRFVSPMAYIDSAAPVDGKGLDDVKLNFMHKYLRYQGRASTSPPKEIYETLTTYFMQRGIQVRHESKYRARNIRVMYDALSATGYSKYNNDINVVCHHVWGWPLPDLQHLDERIGEDFDAAQLVIEANKGGRKSDVVNGWRLWRQLLQAGYECDPAEFRIPQTKDIVRSYETLWKLVCDQLGWDMKVVLCDLGK